MTEVGETRAGHSLVRDCVSDHAIGGRAVHRRPVERHGVAADLGREDSGGGDIGMGSVTGPSDAAGPSPIQPSGRYLVGYTLPPATPWKS